MNTIILKAQELTLQQYNDLKKPHQGKNFKKIFFQCVLKKFENGDAEFGLVAYGAYKKGGKKIGPPVPLQDMPGSTDTIITTWPLTFGNLEFDATKRIKKGLRLAKDLNKLLKSKKVNLVEKSIQFKPFITENPHLDYTITLDGTTEELNPCPPTPPSDF